MNNWKAKLKADPTDWLLESTDPSIRYYTLIDILNKPETDSDVVAAKKDIMRIGPVPAILDKQREGAYEDGLHRFYLNKYQGLVWRLILLAELGATLNDQICETCEYLLSHSQIYENGGFTTQSVIETDGKKPGEGIPCLSGNMVWCFINLGYVDDPRVQNGIGWIINHSHLADGMDQYPGDIRYIGSESCYGKHTCFMGAVKSLKALAYIPKNHYTKTEAVYDVIAKTTEYMLVHHIYKRSHDLNRVSKPGWLKFGFPLLYQTDILEILDVLLFLGVRDYRMKDAVEIVKSDQRTNGRWYSKNATINANNKKLLIPFSRTEQNKWVTLRAMRVLKKWDEF